MSSFARRSMRATAAVAGITAVGVGLAGPAFAAPEVSDRPGTDGTAPAAPDAGSTPNILGDLPSAPGPADLPQLFTVEDTSVYTADGSLPELPTPDQLPADQLPDAGDVVNIEGADQVAGSDIEYQAAAPQERGSAMQELDAASMFGDLTGQVLGATEGNDVRA